MNTAPVCRTVVSPVAAPASRRRVVDAPTRMFHWLFALSFLGAYVTADGERWRALHATLGYTLAALLAFRVLYGLVGPRHARLVPLFRRLAGAPTWLRSLVDAVRRGGSQGVNWRHGQNLLTALAVVALLLLALPLTISGYATFSDWGDSRGGEMLADVHEFFGEAILAVVFVHLGLIAGLSLLRGKNQALPMWSGYVDGAGPDVAKHNRTWLAALLLVFVVAFVGWQWQQSPSGLVPGNAWAQAPHDGHDDD